MLNDITSPNGGASRGTGTYVYPSSDLREGASTGSNDIVIGTSPANQGNANAIAAGSASTESGPIGGANDTSDFNGTSTISRKANYNSVQYDNNNPAMGSPPIM